MLASALQLAMLVTGTINTVSVKYQVHMCMDDCCLHEPAAESAHICDHAIGMCRIWSWWGIIRKDSQHISATQPFRPVSSCLTGA